MEEGFDASAKHDERAKIRTDVGGEREGGGIYTDPGMVSHFEAGCVDGRNPDNSAQHRRVGGNTTTRTRARIVKWSKAYNTVRWLATAGWVSCYSR